MVPGGAFLGAAVDPETDGVSTDDADGDDASAVSDEDGVVFLSPFKAGVPAEIRVTAGSAGYLSAFFDTQQTGVLTPGTLVSSTGPAALATGAMLDIYIPAAGVYTLSVSVSGSAFSTFAARFRFTNEAGQGGASPSGLALTGEIEDYIINNATLSASVDLRAFATPEGVVLDLWTVDEAGQSDIVVYAWFEGEWVVAGVVPSAEVVGNGSNHYRIFTDVLAEGKTYKLKVVDEVGRAHRPKVVRVKAIRARGLKAAADDDALELAFDTEPGLRYAVKRCDRLDAAPDAWVTEAVSRKSLNGWSTFTPAPVVATGDQTVVRLRRPENTASSFYKIVLAE